MRMLAAIVLYELRADQCQTYRSLLRSSAAITDDYGSVAALLFDNSGMDCEPEALPIGVSYVHSNSKGGVAAAYNYALAMAHDQGFEWLLTLDQDTELPSDFLPVLSQSCVNIAQDAGVAAVAPQIVSGSRILSPYSFWFGAWPCFYPRGYSGFSNRAVFAINSGSLLGVETLHAIGGCALEFWLDSSDQPIFRQLGLHQRRVYVCGELPISHDLFRISRSEPLSPARMQNALLAESAFWDTEMGPGAGAMHSRILIRHFLGLLRRREDPILRKMVFASICKRVFRPKRHRLQQWRRNRNNAYRGLEPALE